MATRPKRFAENTMDLDERIEYWRGRETEARRHGASEEADCCRVLRKIFGEMKAQLGAMEEGAIAEILRARTRVRAN